MFQLSKEKTKDANGEALPFASFPKDKEQR
jgi:hypothetical protein